ncbi:MAG: hypothetical protein WC878_07880 [Candidatus Paceibacterota bacterium]
MIPTLPPPPSFSITPASIWILFAVVAILWAVMTGVLNYHWKAYSIGNKAVFMKFIYLVGSSFFLIVIFLSALTFSLQ